jgi:hypothetical protein
VQGLSGLARRTARREQENVEVCHSRPIRWQFGILFSEMDFSHSLQSGYREMRVVDLTVAANERVLRQVADVWMWRPSWLSRLWFDTNDQDEYSSLCSRWR